MMALMFLHACSACSATPPATSLPDAASTPSCAELVYVARDLAAVVGHYHLSALDDVRRLRMEEADGADDAFNVADIGRCEVRGRGVALPQRGRDLVHAFVGGLGAQQYGDGQAERIAPVVQRALGGGVMLVHALRHRKGALAFGGHGLAWHRISSGCGFSETPPSIMKFFVRVPLSRTANGGCAPRLPFAVRLLVPLLPSVSWG